MQKKTAYFWLTIVGLSITIWILLLAQAKLGSGNMNALDLGIYNQVAWQSAQGDLFGFTIHPHSYLGDHLEFLFLLTVPFYKIWASPLVLILIQSLAVVITGFLIFRFAQRLLSTNQALLWSLIFLLNPFTLNALAFEFHAVLLGLPFIILAALAYVNKNYKLYWLWLILIFLTREDLSLIVAGFSLLGILEKRQSKWWLWPGLASAAWLMGGIFLTGKINGEGYKFFSYGQNVGVTLEAGRIFLDKFLKLFRPQNWFALLALILPVLGLPVLAWRWLALMFLPFLGISLSNQGSGDIILQTHYVAFFLPGIFLAAIFGWQKIWEHPPKFLFALQPHAKNLVTIILVVVSLYGLLTFGPTVGAIKTWSQVSLASEKKADFSRNLSENTPKNFSVVAGYDQLPLFSNRSEIFAAHYAFLGKRQYSETVYPLPKNLDLVIIDAQEFITYQIQYSRRADREEEYASGPARLKTLLESRGLKLSQIFDTLLVFSKTANLNLELTTPQTDLSPAGSKPIKLSLAEKNLKIGQGGVVKLDLNARINQPSNDNYQVELTWYDENQKILESRLLPLGYGLQPTSTWQSTESVTTHFQLVLPGPKTASGKIRAILPEGNLILSGWRSAELKLKPGLPSQSEEIVFSVSV